MKQFLTNLFARGKKSSRPARPASRARLGVEALEQRWTPSGTRDVLLVEKIYGGVIVSVQQDKSTGLITVVKICTQYECNSWPTF